MELFKAKWLNGNAKITPSWLAKGKYNWEVDSTKAANNLGYQITPVEDAFAQTIFFLKQKKNEVPH
jgi:hypothetical protein